MKCMWAEPAKRHLTCSRMSAGGALEHLVKVFRQCGLWKADTALKIKQMHASERGILNASSKELRGRRMTLGDGQVDLKQG